ncbi:MAG: uncharacterized protein QOK40_1480 [Miltoncostaeaceae bacterium]|nr:uncharacterized protein [Miltoncostaeaceae bacterium]
MARSTETRTRSGAQHGAGAARREPPRTRPIEGTDRRPLPAGKVILVAVLAIAIGALLNANGLRKTAQIQSAGWQRDLALALTQPLADLSHALYLDRPRQWLKEALGRGADDRIVRSITLPAPGGATGPGGGPSRVPRPQAKPVFSPAKPLRVWIAGDSLVVVPGQSLLQLVARNRVMKPAGEIDGRVATGLTRPDVFDWFDHVRAQMRTLRPTAVVVSFGANDGHNYMTGLPAGVSIGTLGSPSWTREYARRVGGFMDLVIQRGGYLFWIGAPIARSPTQSRSFATIDRIVRREADKRTRAYFIDTASLLSPGGSFEEYLPNAQGELIRVRAADGVHFAPAGGDRVAAKVLESFRQAFDLTSWQRRATPRPAAEQPARSIG